MYVQLDIVKSPRRQIRPAYQKIHHPAVVEPQIPSLVLIHLQQRNITGSLISDLIEERHSQQLVSIVLLIRLTITDMLRRQAGVITVLIYDDMSVKMLNVRRIDYLICSLPPETEPLARRLQVPEKIIQIREKVKHPLMRKQIFLVGFRNLRQPYLTDESHQILALVVAHSVSQKGKVNAGRQVGKAPPMALCIQALAGLSSSNLNCHMICSFQVGPNIHKYKDILSLSEIFSRINDLPANDYLTK